MKSQFGKKGSQLQRALMPRTREDTVVLEYTAYCAYIQKKLITKNQKRKFSVFFYEYCNYSTEIAV